MYINNKKRPKNFTTKFEFDLCQSQMFHMDNHIDYGSSYDASDEQLNMIYDVPKLYDYD